MPDISRHAAHAKVSPRRPAATSRTPSSFGQFYSAVLLTAGRNSDSGRGRGPRGVRSLVCSSDRCRTTGGSSRVQAIKSLLTLRMMRAINIPCVVKLRLRKLSARQTVLEAVTPAGLGGGPATTCCRHSPGPARWVPENRRSKIKHRYIKVGASYLLYIYYNF